jgi:SAM-dependent methyltransferase
LNTDSLYPACALCDSADFAKISMNVSFGVDIIKCKKCGLIQSEYVSPTALRLYYSDYYRKALGDRDIEKMRRWFYDQAVSQLEYLETVLPQAHYASALEIGAGIGEFAKLISKNCANVFVTEADPQFVKVLRQLEELIYLEENELDSQKFFDTFDLLTLSHVFEHLPNPIESLNQYSRLLKTGGYLFLEIPNESQMLINRNFQGKGHLYYYNVGTLSSIVACQGSFDIVEIRTCNRTIEEFLDSDFSMPEDFNRQCTPNGTSIRALLINNRPSDCSNRSLNKKLNSELIADDYSRRIMVMHQKLLDLNRQMDSMQKKCQRTIEESRQVVENTVSLVQNIQNLK